MDWEREIEVCECVKEFSLPLKELLDILIGELSKDEMEEFGGELIKPSNFRGADVGEG